MRGLRQLKAIWRDPNMKELIDSLWREYYGLYTEKYSRDPEKWLLNYLSPDFDFGQAIGQDHSINGNQSTAIGIGAITRAFREIVLGSYAADGEPLAELVEAEEWNVLDRLITIGNGIDNENRSNALILFKSGLLKIFNGLKLSAYQHGEEEAENGMLQYIESGLFIRHLDEWISLMPHNNYLYIAYASDSSGTGFTMTFDPDLDFIAIQRSDIEIITPIITDFAGIWKNYKGIQGEPGKDGEDGQPGQDGKSAYLLALDNGFVGTQTEWLASLQGKDGNDGSDGQDGVSAYLYIAYASSNTGTGFTTMFDAALDYIAIKAISVMIPSPQESDFTGLWKKYKGENGDPGTGGGTATNEMELCLDFQDLTVFTYNVPDPMKFTSQIAEATEATLSIALNTNLSAYDKLEITPTSIGLVKLIGELI